MNHKIVIRGQFPGEALNEDTLNLMNIGTVAMLNKMASAELLNS